MTAAQYIVFGSYLGAFALWSLQWVLAQRNRSDTGRVINPRYRIGALLEGAAFAIVWLSPQGSPPEWMQWVGAGLAVVAAAFGILAGHHLGRHFRVQAVVTDAHELIRTGPYAVVRHPIYASLIGLLIGGALATGRLVGLALAIPVFLAGTEIRVRAEDKILRDRFGPQFEEYRSRVPAYLPGIR